MSILPFRTNPDETPTYIYNPSKDDFTCYYDRQPYLVPSRKMVQLPKFLADHVAKHLAQKMALLDSDRIHYEERVKKWMNEIYLKVE